MHIPLFSKAFVLAMVASLFLSACANCPTHAGAAQTRHHPGKKKGSSATSESTPTPKPTPTPEQNPQATAEIHAQQLALIKGLAKESFSADQAKEVLTEFAPTSFDTSGDPKKRLHVLISKTSDPAVLSEMGEKIPH
jgi:hypothetical protein